MTAKTNVSSVQLLLMGVGSALMFPKTFMPVLNSPPGNQDVWIVVILTFVYIIILNIPILFVVNKCRGLTINDMSEIILGKFFGKAACLLFAAFCLFCFTMCGALATAFTGISVLPETPS
ncbi:MAG: GerAB/ArcD/ProY family transporter, partial [Clostridiales bacterium]|nr:GerAB/ArcD/ProY family transporter [Clostridiales bacterium]